MAEQKCRYCGCTDSKACARGCFWVKPDACSACVDPVTKKRLHHGGNQFNPRLKPFVEILDAHPKGLTTAKMDTELRAKGVYNYHISTSMADLRKCGFQIECHYVCRNKDGKKVYYYRREAA